jgi:hypothetical protein
MSDFLPSLERGSEIPDSRDPTWQSFLVESERRVIGHCLRLLAAPDLTAEHRQRLTRLVAAAETELQHLAA